MFRQRKEEKAHVEELNDETEVENAVLSKTWSERNAFDEKHRAGV